MATALSGPSPAGVVATTATPAAGTRWVYITVAVFAAAPLLATLHQPLYTLDEALLLVYPEQILRGRVPNVDFYTSYGPGGLALLSAAYAATGPSVVVERLVGIAYHSLIATGVVAGTRRFGSTISLVAGTISAVLLLPLGPAAYAWLGAVGIATWSAALISSGRAGVQVAGGFMATLSMSFRPEIGLAVGLAAAPFLWRRRSVTVRWLAGAAVGALPLVLHLSIGGWRLWANFLDRATVNTSRPLSDLAYGERALFIALVAATLILLGKAIGRRARADLALAGLSIGLLPQTLQRVDIGHILYVACVTVPTCLAVLIGLRRPWNFRGLSSRGFATGLVVSLAVAITGVTLQGATAEAGRDVAVLRHSGRSMPTVEPAERAVLAQVLASVDTHVARGASIFVGSDDTSVPSINDMRLYHMLPEHSADAYNLELPAPADQKSPLLPDLREADALVLWNVPESWGRRLFPGAPTGTHAADRYVRRHFCVIRRVRGYSVWTRCDQ